jgi:plastocyanin
LRGAPELPHDDRVAVLALLVCILAAGCGSGSPVSPTPPPVSTQPTITITSAGIVTPAELVVSPGARVLFVNNDSRRHDIASDPHPEHVDCPEINQVGVLIPGASRETGNLVTVRTCGFHDHENPTNNNLRGRIVIR